MKWPNVGPWKPEFQIDPEISSQILRHMFGHIYIGNLYELSELA